MKNMLLLLLVIFAYACNDDVKMISAHPNTSDSKTPFTVVFASCNDPHRPQPLWTPILEQEPELFIWGGDNVYADTNIIEKMRGDYAKIWEEQEYQQLAAQSVITGTWDDHDYGKNDAGVEWSLKAEAQVALLDFLKVPIDDERRSREGVYTSQVYETEQGSVKVILLDTRYFRTAINPSPLEGRSYDPWPAGSGGSILGESQWNWLKKEFEDTSTQFTLVVSSIQLLSKLHGWEKWGNHPEERERMLQLIEDAKANNIIFLTGDRHLAELSMDEIDGKRYPLIEFTSSGMTHTWIDSPTSRNPYRISNVVKRLNFGVLKIDFEQEQVIFEIRGEDNFLYERHVQQY